ncbi:MAG: hypothetical protein RLZZ450_5103 [Pseudomonadota bacterium]|jgi:signal transduction histidine kinase
MHFAPPLDGPRFDVQSVDAQTLVVSRARSDGPGLEGFLVDVPSLIASLEQRVLKQRGLGGIAQLSVRAADEPGRRDGLQDLDAAYSSSTNARDFRYPYRFSAPFSAVAAELHLAALDDTREARFLELLAAGFAALVLAGVYALYRMVAVQVRFAERRANFVSAVSHELKTPLTAIRMYGELLRDGLVDNDGTRQEYYGLITTESERLSRLVDNVLRLGQIERRRDRPAPLPLRTLPSFGATLELLRPRAEALGFVLVVDLEPGLPQVQYDADGLAQVLFNAVDNALKYARDATDKTIDVRCARHADGVLLTVRDRGPGVAAAELTRLGEPFYRVGSELTRGQQGVGLGLSLVKRIVEDMGGRVTLKNAAPGFELAIFLRGESH